MNPQLIAKGVKFGAEVRNEFNLHQDIDESLDNIEKYNEIQKSAFLEDKISSLIAGSGLKYKDIVPDFRTNPNTFQQPDWLSQIPDSALKKEVKSFYENGQINQLVSYKHDIIEARVNKKLEHNRVDALILSGGGAKGLAYSGLFETLEKQGKLRDIEFVAGTSAGSITALMAALGYSATEIRTIADKTPFARFFNESQFYNVVPDRFSGSIGKSKTIMAETYAFAYGMSKIADAINSGKSKDEILVSLKQNGSQGNITDNPYSNEMREFFDKHKDALLNGRTNNFFAQTADNVYQNLDKLSEFFGKDPMVEFNSKVIKPLSGDQVLFNSTDEAIDYFEVFGPDQDTIKDMFLAKLVENKIQEVDPQILQEIGVKDYKELTFEQLHQLKQHYQNFDEVGPHFKDLGVVSTILSDGILGYDSPEIANYWHGHSKYKDVPIIEAVRRSMNLPGVYEAIRDVDGKEHTDGGLVANTPKHMALAAGFSPANILTVKLEEADAFVAAENGKLFSEAYKNMDLEGYAAGATFEFLASPIPQYQDAYNMTNEIVLNSQGIGTLDFAASAEEKAELHAKAVEDSGTLFEPTYTSEAHFLKNNICATLGKAKQETFDFKDPSKEKIETLETFCENETSSPSY